MRRWKTPSAPSKRVTSAMCRNPSIRCCWSTWWRGSWGARRPCPRAKFATFCGFLAAAAPVAQLFRSWQPALGRLPEWPMHLPDGFLSAPVAAGYGALSLLGVAGACYRLRAARQRGQQALLGVSAAFIFAAQMVSFPVAAGTSGHLVGAVLAVALLGLPSALVVMTSVLLVQCFVF